MIVGVNVSNYFWYQLTWVILVLYTIDTLNYTTSDTNVDILK